MGSEDLGEGFGGVVVVAIFVEFGKEVGTWAGEIHLWLGCPAAMVAVSADFWESRD